MSGAGPREFRARTIAWAHAYGVMACLVGLVVVALALRIEAASRVVYPTVDGVHYMDTARAVVGEGRLPFSTFPPGWPLLIAAAASVHGSTQADALLHTAQAWNVILGSAAGILVFGWLRRRLAAGWSLLGAALFLFLPETITASSTDLSEMAYVVALLGAWLLFERHSSWLAGLLFGMAYLVRPEALIIFAALWLHRALRDRDRRYSAWVGISSVVIPYVLFMHSETGAWMLSSKNAFLETAVDQRSFLEMVRQWGVNLLALLRALPGLVGVPILLLAVVAMGLRRGRALYAFLPLLLLPLFSFRMDPRYWLPLLPFVLLYALQGAELVLRRWPRRIRGTAIVLSTLILVGAWQASRDDWKYVGANFEFYPGMRQAGLWLAPQLRQGDVVVDYKPYVAFWAGAQFRKLPPGRDARGVVEWARENGAEYLVVNRHLVGSLTPELAPLLGELPAPIARNLQLVHLAEVAGDPRQTTAVFRIRQVGEAPRAAEPPR